MSNVLRKLQLLKQEDFIWLIYFFIVTFAVISNKFERKSVIYNDAVSRKQASRINTTILVIAFFIYLYFVLMTFDDLKNLQRVATRKEVKVTFERFIANLLFLVGGAVAIYADFDSNTIGTDIAIS